MRRERCVSAPNHLVMTFGCRNLSMFFMGCPSKCQAVIPNPSPHSSGSGAQGTCQVAPGMCQRGTHRASAPIMDHAPVQVAHQIGAPPSIWRLWMKEMEGGGWDGMKNSTSKRIRDAKTRSGFDLHPTRVPGVVIPRSSNGLPHFCLTWLFFMDEGSTELGHIMAQVVITGSLATYTGLYFEHLRRVKCNGHAKLEDHGRIPAGAAQSPAAQWRLKQFTSSTSAPSR